MAHGNTQVITTTAGERGARGKNMRFFVGCTRSEQVVDGWGGEGYCAGPGTSLQSVIGVRELGETGHAIGTPRGLAMMHASCVIVIPMGYLRGRTVRLRDVLKNHTTICGNEQDAKDVAAGGL